MDSFRLIFAAVAPPFEATALKEFIDKTSGSYKSSLDPGGFFFEAPLSEVAYLQKYLKSPTRLLLRIKEQRIRDFPKLYKVIQNIPWNQYLLNGQYQLHISAKKSRLNNEKRIEESFHKAMAAYFKAHTAPLSKTKYCHQIYLRLNNDQCSLSIDLSGEPLYKRGRLKKIHQAPIRENLAYMILYSIKDHFNEESPFIDPMCGSGTFAEEVLHWHKESPRDFAIQYLPKIKEQKIDLQLKPLVYKDMHLNDLSEEALKVAKENLGGEKIQYSQLDILDFFKKAPTKGSIIVCNFPYGKRVAKTKEDTKQWLQALEATGAKKILCISDSKAYSKKWQERAFYNGGIKVWLLESK